MSEVEELVERLKLIAKQHSETARMIAEAKSLRQESNTEGRRDLYMWPKPEETPEWKAAATITRLSEENERLTRAVQAILDSWDANTHQRERFVQAEVGDYWSPASAMVDSEHIANARAVITQGESSRGKL